MYYINVDLRFMTIHSFPFTFFSLVSLYSFLFPTPFSLSFPCWYACVTGNLQFKWRYICLYLANYKTGLKLEDMLLNEFLFLQCHALIPSNLFTVIRANCDSKLNLYAVDVVR